MIGDCRCTAFQCSIAQFVKQCLLKFRDNFPRAHFYLTFGAQTFRLLSHETVSYTCPCSMTIRFNVPQLPGVADFGILVWQSELIKLKKCMYVCTRIWRFWGHSIHSSLKYGLIPYFLYSGGIWHQNGVVFTSVRRDDATAAPFRRHSNVMWLLGTVPLHL